MILNSFGIVSLILYTSWTACVMYDRYLRVEPDSPPFNWVYVAEVAYCILMLYLLVTSSMNFLYATLLVALIHVVAGAYTEIFKPQERVANETMAKYWSYLSIDFAVSMISYLLINL